MEPVQFKRRDFLLGLAGFGATMAASQLQTKDVIALDPSLLIAQGKVTLTGAGASFPAPLYTRWFSEYNRRNSNIEINYQSVGSGAGVNQFIAGTVDFGASDVAMTDAEIAKVSKGVVLLPMTAGSVVVAYNLPGVRSLRLSRQVLGNIFSGKIKKWNDPAIRQLNSGVNFPNTDIRVIYRSDASGTTAAFTEHLKAAAPGWTLGSGRSIQWAVGVGAKGNEGITAQVQQTPGAIGYVEYSYAKLNRLATASLQNRAGNYVQANAKTSSESLSKIELPGNLRAFEPNPEGANSYPIVTYTWMMAYRNYGNAAKANALKAMLNWALTSGQQLSDDLGYIPLPSNVVNRVRQAVNLIK